MVVAKVKRVFVLVILTIMLGLIVTGCTGPSIQGWSGFASIDNLVYVGSMDGAVLAVNPSARRSGVNFPSQGEWDYTIKVPSAGNVCGPLLSCGQQAAASKVVIYSSPAVSTDLVYVGTYSGKVMAISRLEPTVSDDFPSRKKNEWVFPKGDKYIGAIVGNVVLFEDTLYVCSTDGKVYALDAKYGDKKWEFQTNERIWSSPAVSGGVVYVGSYDGRLYAIASKDGNKLWQLDLPATMCSSPVVSDDTIYFGAFDHCLYAVNKTEAKIMWKFQGGNWFWAEPVVKGNVVYASCLDGKIYAIDAASGTKLWQFAADTPIISRPVVVTSVVAAVSESGTLYVMDTSNGAEMKKISIGSKVMAPLYAIENVVYVHARDNSIHAVDIRSGESLWKFKVGSKQD